MNNLFIDGQNVSFMANMATELKTSNGRRSSGVAGFFNILRSQLERFDPEKVVVCWDGGRTPERMSIHPDYKAGRQEKDDEYITQVQAITVLVGMLGLAQMQGKGIEADDIIGKLATTAEIKGQKSVIVSSDQDFLQLVTERTSVFNPLSNAKVNFVTVDNMEQYYGLPPDKWLEYKAMLGDKSDRIGGITGVGKKTAMNILKKFGSYGKFREIAYGPSAPTLSSYEHKALDGTVEFQKSKTLMDLRNPLCSFVNLRIIKTDVDVNNGLEGFERTAGAWELNKVVSDMEFWKKYAGR